MDIAATQDHEAKVGDVVDVLTAGDEHASIDTQRSIELQGRAADPMLAKVIQVQQHTDWAPQGGGAVSAAIATEITGAPLKVSGTYRVEPTPSGCRSVVELTLDCTMAMLGGRLLANVEPFVTRTLADELARLDTVLQSRR